MNCIACSFCGCLESGSKPFFFHPRFKKSGQKIPFVFSQVFLPARFCQGKKGAFELCSNRAGKKAVSLEQNDFLVYAVHQAIAFSAFLDQLEAQFLVFFGNQHWFHGRIRAFSEFFHFFAKKRLQPVQSVQYHFFSVQVLRKHDAIAVAFPAIMPDILNRVPRHSLTQRKPRIKAFSCLF